MIRFETVGWRRVSIEQPDVDAVEAALGNAGVRIESFYLAPLKGKFDKFIKSRLYQGNYRDYGGTADHCLIEKALEHFISFELIKPTPGMTAIDIGSCRSVVPQMVREQFACRCFEQDLDYTPGLHG